MSGYEGKRLCRYCKRETNHWISYDTISCIKCGSFFQDYFSIDKNHMVREKIIGIIKAINNKVKSGYLIDIEKITDLIYECINFKALKEYSIDDIKEMVNKAVD